MKKSIISMFVFISFFIGCEHYNGNNEQNNNEQNHNEINIFTIVFDKNNGDIDANPRIITVTAPITTIDQLPEEPTREGYIFIGWNLKQVWIRYSL